MVRAIIQGYLNVNNRVACEDTGLHSALDTLHQQARIYSFGIAPPTILLMNS